MMILSVSACGGKRVYSIPEKYGVIGYATATNKSLIKRMFRVDLTMHRAVLLACYLVTQSKNIDIGVGGETRIALVAENGAYFDERDYVSTVETRAADFLKLTDDLFLLCADLSISETQLSQQLDEYKARIVQQRREHLQATADWLFSTGFASAAPYSYLPSFVLTLMADGRTVFSEDAEQLNAMQALIEKFKSHPLFFKCSKCGAEVEYLVEETERGTLISHDIAAKDIAVGTLRDAQLLEA